MRRKTRAPAQRSYRIPGIEAAVRNRARREPQNAKDHRTTACSRLSDERVAVTSAEMTNLAGAPLIFDPERRRKARDRAHESFTAHDFLYRHMAEGLMDRLADVQRPLERVLLIGCPNTHLRNMLVAAGKSVSCCDPGARNAAGGGVQAEEDALPYPASNFDLVMACGTLDSVNDLPGALINIYRLLRPDGLFLAAMTGAGSLPVMRRALIKAEDDRPVAHIHPQIDVRTGGDLLMRAGFAMPVADMEVLTVRYSSLLSLMRDLRGMGAGNVMAGSRCGPLRRDVLAAASTLFTQAADADGKTGEQFATLYLSGWKPDPSQPLPARRGSGKISLADALRPKD